MKILLIGEYSNVHATLAKGLRKLGQDVTLISNGDFWKNYPRDIDVSRSYKKLGGIRLFAKIICLLPKMRGYDVVQLINPMFFELKAERLLPIYKYLRKHNKKIFLGAFGMDYYWVHENITRFPLRYSDFNFGHTLRTDEEALKEEKDWIGTNKENLNKYIAEDCDGIIAGLYEYLACYKPIFPKKTTFIPFPITIQSSKFKVQSNKNHKVQTSNFKLQSNSNHKVQSSKFKVQSIKLFIGINKNRSRYKGTDIMLAAAKAVKEKYPDKIELRIAEGLPFYKYIELMQGSDAIMDQLYSYTPAMNALEAMGRGIIVIGGGEEENYDILGEKKLRPIVNVQPNYDSVYHELEQLVLHPERIPSLKEQSIEYIKRHHDYIKVASQYLQFYKNIKSK